jgi:hypothetical protein
MAFISYLPRLKKVSFVIGIWPQATFAAQSASSADERAFNTRKDSIGKSHAANLLRVDRGQHGQQNAP